MLTAVGLLCSSGNGYFRMDTLSSFPRKRESRKKRTGSPIKSGMTLDTLPVFEIPLCKGGFRGIFKQFYEI
jgi:hypothetical protein